MNSKYSPIWAVFVNFLWNILGRGMALILAHANSLGQQVTHKVPYGSTKCEHLTFLVQNQMQEYKGKETIVLP